MSSKKERRKRRTYTPEFKRQIVDLYRNGKRKCDIIREYDLAHSLLDKWIAQADHFGSFKKKITGLRNRKNSSDSARKTSSSKWKTIF